MSQYKLFTVMELYADSIVHSWCSTQETE